MNKKKDSERTYVVEKFWSATNEFFTSEHIIGWTNALEECIKEINDCIKRWNDNKHNPHIDYIEWDEAQEIFENNQNFIIGGVYTFGILDITPDEPELEDYLVLIKGCKMNEMDIKAIEMPFTDESFFREYMKRVCTILGGTYQLMKPHNFDVNLCTGAIRQGYQFDYVAHTQLPK